MRLVSVAKAAGGVHTMFPQGCNVENIPADLMLSIDHSLRILSWQENMIEDEMPPRWMWHLDHELELHFKVLKDKRENAGSSSSSTDSSPSTDEWEENAYSARFK